MYAYILIIYGSFFMKGDYIMKISKDSKGRNLRPNEDQLKDGRYRYRYTDKYGNRKAIYSWMLVKTDKVPPGKKSTMCLREMIRQIEKDLEDGIDSTTSANMTVADLILFYLGTKPKLANSTKNNYLHILEKNIQPNYFGKIKLGNVKKSDVKNYYSYLYKEKGFAVGTIQLYQNLIFPAFQLAVDDNLIRKNPCKGCMKEYTKDPDKKEKTPLTLDEQKALLRFLKDSIVYSKYYVMVALMLSTGCRISEVIGLTWKDIDLENRTLDINHQIVYKKKDGKIKHYAEPPKNRTERKIPLKEDIVEVLEFHKQKTYFASKCSRLSVDGYDTFVFINHETNLFTPNTLVRAFHQIVEVYNSHAKEGDILLPDFTPHILRHTFCTRMAESGMDVKALQKIMGHKTITVTMEVYNHADFERTKKNVESIPSMLALEA